MAEAQLAPEKTGTLLGHPIDEAAARRDPRLSNEDLVPLNNQRWSSYNLFAFWMSDVHSIGGYVTAGSLFALGLASWQVLVALLVGIVIVQVFCNLVAKPSQKTGVPYPVINRAVFGVKGANIPAIIRGLIAVAWYGVQTFLASEALVIVFLKFFPAMKPLYDVHQYGFLGLSALGWICYGILWVAQAALFWNGMESIRKFIDFAGPAVYVVMLVLAIYLVSKAGVSNISLNLSAGEPLDFAASIPVMISAIALVVSYFSGPMLNFGDFARYGKSFKAVKKGNLLGLPVNFLFFSLLTVITASATTPVLGTSSRTRSRPCRKSIRCSPCCSAD
ncbi:probable allantoin permease [Arthrobacter sp. Hiyo1]|uniref:cytosine permease n=1 Tax=Arthrobacter sp. Hiyo1 TaxID=1588020 RepID=UPI0006A3C110|nr:cytosine permease [Arthrobacter sp. Hiyo1]GAP60418.1 probable allantoin permease [Arthrobacter sp. Hiyo1]